MSVFVPLGLALLVISFVVMYKTRFGLRLRSCGEHPQAADSVGINVYKMRYAGVLISGALGRHRRHGLYRAPPSRPGTLRWAWQAPAFWPWPS